MSDFYDLERNIKSDPKSYTEDFLLQLHHLKTSLNLLHHSPSNASPELCKLVLFVASVAYQYKEHCQDIAHQLMTILEKYVQLLDPDLRKRIVDSLIRFRQAKIIQSADLLPIFFKIFSVHDKNLRSTAYEHIVGDLSNLFKKGRDAANMRSLQNYVSSMLNDVNPTAARYAAKVLIRMYRKGIWNDARTVTYISKACFSKDTRTLVAALQFFLGTSDEQEEKERAKREAQEEANVENIKHHLMMDFKNKHSRKTKRKKSRLMRALANANKLDRTNRYEDLSEGASRKAIDLLNDPQKFASKLFNKLKSSPERFEVRVMMMDVVAKCIDAHKLILLNFYPFMQKYLRPAQVYVPRLLVICATAVHNQVPDDDIYPMLMTIANNFIHSKSPVNHIVAGLNGIRAICARQPLVMRKNVLRDLAQYKSSKDKHVQAAAKGLIHLYRDLDPKMLAKKDRGRLTKEEVEERQMMEYGEKNVPQGIPGIELLHEYKQGLMKKGSGEDETATADATEGSKLEQEKQKQELIARLSSGEFLSQEDFRLLKTLQLKQKVDTVLHNKKSSAEVNAARKKLKQIRNDSEATLEDELEFLEEMEDEIESSSSEEEIELDDIATAEASENAFEDKKEKWQKKGRRPDISQTNRAKKKNKNAQMIKFGQGVKRKLRASQHEKANKKRKVEKKELKWKLKGY